MGCSSVVCIAVSFAVLALLFVDPVHGTSCGIQSSPKFQANQTVVYPGTYYWRVSPCGAVIWCPSIGPTYITQYDQIGNCDPANLNCKSAPKVAKTSDGYMFSFDCGRIDPYGGKDAVVNVNCTSGPLRLIGDGVPLTVPSPNNYLFTFNMEGECNDDVSPDVEAFPWP